MLARYTLKAARRAGFRRGESFTCPVGSELDLATRSDPAWARSQVIGVELPARGSRDAVALVHDLLRALQGLAHRARQLPAGDRDAYGAELREHLEQAWAWLDVLLEPANVAELLDREIPVEIPVELPELPELQVEPTPLDGPDLPEPELGGADELDGAPVIEGDSHEDARSDLLAAVNDCVSAPASHTIADLVELATRAGIVVPTPLPRRKADLIDLLYELATTET